MGVFYPYDADGRMLGEDTYVGSDGHANLRVPRARRATAGARPHLVGVGSAAAEPSVA